MNRLTTFLFVVSAVLQSCHSNDGKSTGDNQIPFNKDSLTNDIKRLSSDEFEGRRPFTRGETKTVNYLSKSFAAMGLEPGNGTSYFQDVSLVEITPEGEPLMKVSSKKGSIELKKMDDYVMWSENTDPEVSLKNDDVIFVGFGVVAPEYSWNDYADIDVKGKVVMVLVNDPGYAGTDTSLFKGTRMTYYGRWTYKFEEAARQGAKGCIIIHNTAAASYPFNVIQNSWGKAQMHLDSRGSREYRCPVEGWITESAARRILLKSTSDTSILRKANNKGFKPVDLNVGLTTSMKIKAVFNQSKNVIGKITGTKRPDEYIIYTAHWDHFGIGKPDEKGDSIYNGASDNASGTAALLELARAFRSLKTKPERTIIFLSVTAEEQGLLGSAWYAQHPIYQLDKTVADINTDVINSIGRMKDIEIVGAGQSDLEDYLKEEVTKKGRYIAPETHPEAGHYFRSDHFNFAKAGVPALTLGNGVDNVDKGKEFGKKQQELYNEKYYHRPSDEYDSARWNLDGAMEDIELLFNVGKRLAFETTFPQWKNGSEFKSLRK